MLRKSAISLLRRAWQRNYVFPWGKVVLWNIFLHRRVKMLLVIGMLGELVYFKLFVSPYCLPGQVLAQIQSIKNALGSREGCAAFVVILLPLLIISCFHPLTSFFLQLKSRCLGIRVESYPFSKWPSRRARLVNTIWEAEGCHYVLRNCRLKGENVGVLLPPSKFFHLSIMKMGF